MGRKLFLISGLVATIAAACGDNTSDGTPGTGGGGQSGKGGKANAGTSNLSGGTKGGGGAAGSATAGEPSGGGSEQDTGGNGNQAGDSSTSGGNGSIAGEANAGGSGVAEGGAGPVGMAGEPGSSAGMPGMAPEGGAPACVNATPRYIAGSLDGEAVDYTVHSGSAYSRNMPLPTLFDWRARVGSDGLLHVIGPTPLTVVGSSGAVQAHLLMASEGPSAGTHYCAASGTMQRVDTFRHYGSLSEWTELGTCPDNPGTGSLTGCYEQTSVGAVVACASDQARLVGNIGNTAIDMSYNANTVIKEGSIEVTTFFAFGNGGLLVLSTVSNVGSGYLRLPDDGPSPGLIVCIGTATLTPGALSDRYTFTLGSLGVVGTCPGATGVAGTLEGCL